MRRLQKDLLASHDDEKRHRPQQSPDAAADKTSTVDTVADPEAVDTMQIDEYSPYATTVQDIAEGLSTGGSVAIAKVYCF